MASCDFAVAMPCLCEHASESIDNASDGSRKSYGSMIDKTVISVFLSHQRKNAGHAQTTKGKMPSHMSRRSNQ